MGTGGEPPAAAEYRGGEYPGVPRVEAAECGESGNVTDYIRQHRTMGAAGFSGSFVPIVQYEKWEIHSVFPHFLYFRSGYNRSQNLLAPLCGVAIIQT